MYIVRQVRGREGIINEFTFMPKGSLLQECADFVTVHCKMSDHIDIASGKMDMTVELSAPGFRRHMGKPSIMLRIQSSPNSGIRFEYPIEMSDAEFRRIMGLSDDEWDGFCSELVQDISASCAQIGFSSKNFRICVVYSLGEPKKIRFRPKSMIADYLMEVGIDLDLSGFIDLENMPKKKGKNNEPIEVYMAKLREELNAAGWSELEIEREVRRQSIVEQYDLMLSLYYGSKGEFFPLCMYTLANGEVRFSNGESDNLYQQDLTKVLGIPFKELKDFKENLQQEVLAVLHEMGIKYMSNSVYDLGLDEPWADSVQEIDMEKINKLRKKPSKSSKAKKKKVAI